MIIKRSSTYFIGVLVTLLLPTTLSLVWYQISDDPNMRPLGITREALREYSGLKGAASPIVANVVWPDTSDAIGRVAFERAITNGFAAKGVDVQVAFSPGVGAIQVTYAVGKSVIGPFPASRAADGISAAVEAYHMNAPPDG